MSSFDGNDNTAASLSDHEENDESNEQSSDGEREEEGSRGPLSSTSEHLIKSQPHLNDQDKALESNSEEETTSQESLERSDRQEEERLPSEESQNCVDISNPQRMEQRQTTSTHPRTREDKEQSLGISNNNHTPGAAAAPRESDHQPFASSVPKHGGATTASPNDEVVWVPGSLVVVQPEEHIPTAIAIDAEEHDQTLQEFVPPTQEGQQHEDHHPSHGAGEQLAGTSPLAPEMHPGIQVMSVVMDEGNVENRGGVPLVNADPVDRTQLNANVKLSALFRSRKLYVLMCLVILLTMIFTWGLEEFVLWAIDNEDDSMVTSVNISIDETGSTMESFVIEVLQIADPIALTNSSSPQYRALEWLFSDMNYVRILPNYRRVQRYALATLCFSMMQFETPEDAQDAIGWLASNTNLNDMNSNHYELEHGVHECEWPTSLLTSVVCRDGRFIILHLVGKSWNLIGRIPPELALLTDLVSINLSNNHLVGSLPTHVGMMTKLESLIVEDNELTGPIPTQIGKLQALTRLSLPKNHLSSSLPSEIGLLNELGSMDFHNNKLTGSIPEEIRFLNSSFFYALDLHMNSLTGTIPTALGELVEFRHLDLSWNNFNGTIPTELGLLKHMNGLNLYSIPNLSGAIPSEFESMTSIDVLLLHNTSLDGRVPAGICNFYREDQLQIFMISCSMVDCSCNCPCMEDYEIGDVDLEYVQVGSPIEDDIFLREPSDSEIDDYYPSDGVAAESDESGSVAIMLQPWLLVVGLGMLVVLVT